MASTVEAFPSVMRPVMASVGAIGGPICGKFAPNCVRLFILLDALLKVYVYETKPAKDPRFHVDEPTLQRDVLRYQLLIAQQRMFRKAVEQFFPGNAK